jgi:hypothetical protein
MNIILHIERLTIDEGFIGRGQRMTLQAAVETELSRLFSEGGLAEGLQSGAALPSIRPLTMQMKGASGSKDVGTQIAQTVYRGIGK